MTTKIIQGVKGILHKGKNNYCPICTANLQQFKPYGVRKRANAQCPVCKSLERHRLIWLYFQQQKLLKEGMSLLHISPETVLFQKFRAVPGIRYVPADKFEPGYRYPKGTIDMDITSIQFEENTFDALLCVHVLEHVPDDQKAMRELYRVLKPGGWAIILVPLDTTLEHTFEDPGITDPQERIKHFGQADHVRQYGRDYGAKLQSAGFSLQVEPFAEAFSSIERKRFGLPENEDIYFCTKPQ